MLSPAAYGCVEDTPTQILERIARASDDIFRLAELLATADLSAEARADYQEMVMEREQTLHAFKSEFSANITYTV
jgi:hypothetical protein